MKKWIAALAVGAAIVTGGATFSNTALAEEIDVTVVAGHPPVFRWVKHVSGTFIPEVDKALEGTEYSINWDEQYGGSLAKVGDALEAVEAGLAQVGVVSTLFEQAKLSVQNVTYYTPFVSTDVGGISELIDSLHESNEDMRKSWEKNGLEYLGAAIGIDDYLLMTNFPVNSIEDLEGKKIGAPGAAVNWLEGTGAVGVSGNLTTYYNEIKTGVYDGVIVFASAALPGKLYEVAPYITKIGFGAQYAGGLAANKEWFDSQPEVVQQALKDAAKTSRIAYHADLDEAVKAAFKAMEEQGATITEVDAEFRQQWAAGMDNLAREWASELDAAGEPGTAVLDTYMESMRSAGATPLRDWDKE